MADSMSSGRHRLEPEGLPLAPSGAVPLPPAPPPRSRRHRALKPILITLAAVLVVAGSVTGYVVWKATNTVCRVTNGQGCNVVTVVRMGGRVAQSPPTVEAPTLSSLQTDANGRTNILLLGTSDDRQDGGDGANGAWLTDSIMVVSLSQADQNAFMISIPRDLWVRYPKPCTVGYQGKVNAAYFCAGAGTGNTPAQDQAAMTATIPVFETITGLQIQYAVNLNYSVLGSLVTAVGGSITVEVTSTNPQGVYDVNTGLKLNPNTPQCPSAATQPMICTIDAATALNLARARNSDGGYGLAASNFDREQNQQAIIVGLMRQAETNGFFTNLSGVTAALTGIGDNLRSTFSLDDIPSLMNLARGIPAENFTSLDFINAKPAIIATPTINGQSAVAPLAGTFDYSAIQAWIARAMSSNPALAENATIDVLNGSTTAGLATSTANQLKALGYTVGAISDYSPGVVTTEVWDVTGAAPLTAAALAQQFGVTVQSGTPPGYQPSSQADLVVILGG